jgi:tetratricopeptide (TPR) repeat protein
MQLQTLGGLALPETQLTRLKPLLLLTYLSLEGTKERRFLVELFWPKGSNGLASLSTAIYRINQEAPGAIDADELRVWTPLKTDAHALLQELRQDSFDLSLYPGAFAQGAQVADISSELEDWILEKRDDLAGKVQTTLLKQAERMAALGQFSQAAERTQALLRLPGTTGLEPEDLLRCYLLLHASESELAESIHKELQDFDIDISISSSEAKERLRQVFVGRKAELGSLTALPAGQWAWLRGGSGLGKTSLLQQLPGHYLAGQAGLPFATLEPLIGEVVQSGSEAILRRLLRQEGILKLDDWEQADPESQDVFKKLRNLKGTLRVVIASSQPPAFAVHKFIELSPLTNEHLESNLWEQTGGVPSLVGAYIRGEKLEGALSAALHNLSETARHLYLSLALLQEPDLGLVKRALDLSAGALADALEELMGAGLAQAGGKVWPRELARVYLQTRPKLLGQLALPLARVLETTEALPLYQLTRTLWSDEDIPKVQTAYAELAEETLQRGFPKRAVEIIEEVPLNNELRLLKARALENIGLYKKALEALGVAKEPKAEAFKGRLLWKLGEPEQALEIASRLQKSRDVEVRAEALLTLGLLDWAKGEFGSSEENFGRAAALWQTTNKRDLWADAVNCMALARMDSRQSIERVEEKLAEAANIAGNNPFLQARLLLNRATTYQKHERFEEAIALFTEAIPVAQAIEAKETESRLWNNMGVCFHFQNNMPEAQHAYEQSLALVRELGETLMIGTTMANLAELTNNRDAWEEAIRILEEGGHYSMAERYKKNVTYHPVRPRSDPQD